MVGWLLYLCQLGSRAPAAKPLPPTGARGFNHRAIDDRHGIGGFVGRWGNRAGSAPDGSPFGLVAIAEQAGLDRDTHG